jgi:hypothetical protein
VKSDSERSDKDSSATTATLEGRSPPISIEQRKSDTESSGSAAAQIALSDHTDNVIQKRQALRADCRKTGKPMNLLTLCLIMLACCATTGIGFHTQSQQPVSGPSSTPGTNGHHRVRPSKVPVTVEAVHSNLDGATSTWVHRQHRSVGSVIRKGSTDWRDPGAKSTRSTADNIGKCVCNRRSLASAIPMSKNYLEELQGRDSITSGETLMDQKKYRFSILIRAFKNTNSNNKNIDFPV